jgi:hypothetical protein
MDTPNTPMNDRSIRGLVRHFNKKKPRRVKLVLWVQILPF